MTQAEQKRLFVRQSDAIWQTEDCPLGVGVHADCLVAVRSSDCGERHEIVSHGTHQGQSQTSAGRSRPSVLPDGLKVEVSAPFGAAHTPPLALVARANPECPTASWRV